MWSMEKVRAVSRARVRYAVDMEAPVELAMDGAADQLRRALHTRLEAIVDRQDIQLQVLEYRWPARIAVWGAHWDPGPQPAMLDGKIWVATRPPYFQPPYDSIFVLRPVDLDSARWRYMEDDDDRQLEPMKREVRCSGWDPLQRVWVYESGR